MRCKRAGTEKKNSRKKHKRHKTGGGEARRYVFVLLVPAASYWSGIRLSAASACGAFGFSFEIPRAA